MFFFGWGNNNRQWITDDGMIIMVTWSYFDIFFFPIGFNFKWHLLSDNRSEDKIITYDEVKRLIPENTPKVSLWHKAGLLIAVAFIVIFFLVIGITNKI